jgi:hypothetical protein
MLRLFKGPDGRANEAHMFPTLRDEQNRRWEYEERDENTIPGWYCEEIDSFVPEQDVIVHDSPVVWVNAYLTNLAYGGVEEGGWWYQCGELLESVQSHERDSEEVRERLLAKWVGEDDADRDLSSVNCTGKLRVSVEDFPGASYPKVTPHYE